MIHCLKEKYYIQNDVDLAREWHRIECFLGIVEAVSWLDYHLPRCERHDYAVVFCGDVDIADFVFTLCCDRCNIKFMLFRCAKGYSGDPNKPGRKCIKLPGEINLIRCCN